MRRLDYGTSLDYTNHLRNPWINARRQLVIEILKAVQPEMNTELNLSRSRSRGISRASQAVVVIEGSKIWRGAPVRRLHEYLLRKTVDDAMVAPACASRRAFLVVSRLCKQCVSRNHFCRHLCLLSHCFVHRRRCMAPSCPRYPPSVIDASSQIR